MILSNNTHIRIINHCGVFQSGFFVKDYPTFQEFWRPWIFLCTIQTLSGFSSTKSRTLIYESSIQRRTLHNVLPYAPFTPVRQTIRRPLQSSVVRFSQNRSDRKYERPFTPSPSSVVRHPSSVKIAPGPILTDDGWRTTDDGLGVNGLSYFLSERFWLKRTTDDWSGRRMVWRTGVNGALVFKQ